MQLKKGHLKKLKTLNSIDTEATLSECNEPQIKISLKSPRESKQNLSAQAPSQIAEEAQEEEMVRFSNEKGKNLLKVPHMMGIRKENSLFDTHNFQVMLQSTNQESMKMMIRNTGRTQENNSRYLNQNSILMLLNQEQKQQNYKTSQQNHVFQSNYKKDAQKRAQANRNQRTDEQATFNQKQAKKLKRVNSDFQIMQIRHQKNKDDQYNSPMLHRKEVNYITSNENETPKKYHLQQNKQQALKRPQPTEKQPEVVKNIEKNKQQSSENRLKLKDYLFKTQIQTAKALQQKRKEAQAKRDRNEDGFPQKHPAKKPNSKYILSNQQLCQILKNQIYSDLNQSISYINMIQNTITSNQFISQNPANDELVKIFSLRAMVKDEINKKLELLSKKFTKTEDIPQKKASKITKQTSLH